MKHILILILLSSIFCQNSNIVPEITNIIKCLSKSNIFFSELERIKEALNSKDLLNIINAFKISYNQLKEEIIKCKNNNLRKLTYEDNKHKRFGYPKYVYVLYTQIGEDAFKWYDEGGLAHLKEMCHRKYGQTTWFCVYLSEN